MKILIYVCLSAIMALLTNVTGARTTYTITQDTNIFSLGIASHCNKCTFNIGSGKNLTISSNISLRE